MSASLWICGFLLIAAAQSETAAPPAELMEPLQRGRELQAAGRHQESLRQFERALRASEGLGPLAQSMALEWLASSYLELRRLTEARRVLLRCLELRAPLASRQVPDLHHTRLLTSLGGIELSLKRYREAEEHLGQALHIWKHAPGGRNGPDLAILLNNLAMLNYAQRRYAAAAERLRQVVALCEESAPAGDRRLAQARSNLAGVLSLLGNHDEADRLSRKALSGFSGSLEQEPLTAAELLSIRASVLRKSGRRREAKAVEAQAREFLRRTGLHQRVDVSLLGPAAR
jgi:tetratricopeptide (TPR) repeat protein